MADNNTNDFWSDKDDDFWGKPVVSKDWLSNEAKVENTREDRSENPYLNRAASQPIPQPVTEKWPEGAEGVKGFPVCRVICLIFFLLAVIAVAVSVLSVSAYGKRADLINRRLDYEVVSVTEERFPVYDNNTVIMDDSAYVIFSPDSDQYLAGMPEGEKLIAVYVQVESENYKNEQYALRDMFIGCKKGEQAVFRKNIRDESILSALSYIGFVQEELLSSLIGNGWNEEGYYFFYVPEEAHSITFYAEERRKEQGISVLTRRYEKELQIMDSVDVQALIAEKRED